MKSNTSYPNREDWEETDLTANIPPERDTYTPGEVSTMLKVSRLTVVNAMRACGVQYVSRHNRVPAMDAAGMATVVRYLRQRSPQRNQIDEFLKSAKQVS